MKSHLLVLLLACSSYLFAQNLSPELIVDGGIAFPLDDLSSTDNSFESGFASTGRSLGVGINYPLTKGLYLSFAYNNSAFNMDRTAYDNLVRNNLVDSISLIRPITDEFRYRSSLDKHVNNNINLGLKIDIPFADKWNAYVTPAVAYNWYKRADVAIVVTDSALEIAASESYSVASRFALSLGTGAEYQIADDLRLRFGMHFLTSRHEYQDFELIDEKGNRSVMEINEVVTYSAVSFSIGLNIMLSKPKKED